MRNIGFVDRGVWCFAAWLPPAPEGGLMERASPYDFLIVNNLLNIG
jgi:hypothetical protein